MSVLLVLYNRTGDSSMGPVIGSSPIIIYIYSQDIIYSVLDHKSASSFREGCFDDLSIHQLHEWGWGNNDLSTLLSLIHLVSKQKYTSVYIHTYIHTHTHTQEEREINKLQYVMMLTMAQAAHQRLVYAGSR